jgi:hypothetical protein
MGFYFRKSFGKGPFRINFSKSGISYSAGIKGARVNFSNRGTYVNFGSHGIYNRKKILGFGQKDSPQNPVDNLPVSHEQHTITSGKVEEITDTDSQDFINELTEKGEKISYYNWFGILPLILSMISLFYIFFSADSKTTTHPVTVTKTYIRSSSALNINIRQRPDQFSRILGVVKNGEQFELADESMLKWYKINFNGQEGFVSKKITEKIAVPVLTAEPTSKSLPTLFETAPNLFLICVISLPIFFLILLYYLKKADNKRLLIEIHYEIDDSVKDIYEKFIYHFSALLNCSRVWQYLHSERSYDYKYSSGAGNIITRKPLSKISTNKTPSKIFKTNVEVPYLGLINTELYFFPERLIIKRGKEYGAIMYKNIDCYSSITRFIENESVPSDSVVVGQTWRYLNKNGSPDKRFNNNHQIPICEYSVYCFESPSGLNEKISTSKVGGIDEFVRYIKAIGQLQKRMPAEPTGDNHPFQLLKG